VLEPGQSLALLINRMTALPRAWDTAAKITIVRAKRWVLGVCEHFRKICIQSECIPECRTQTPNFPFVESPLLTIDDNLDRVLFLYSKLQQKSPTNLKK